MEDWFQESLHTKTVSVTNRKHVKYISVDCRDCSLNPIYKMWKACSFTTNDIVFFFFLLNFLSQRKEPVSLAVLHEDYYRMHRSDGFQRSSAQWWLKNKGVPSGIIIKEGHKYSLAPTYRLSKFQDLLFYYSEIAPGGVVGSYVLDKTDVSSSLFGFKQHYIGQAFDCEVLCNALFAIRKERILELDYLLRNKNVISINVFPLKIYSSTQNGRQYLIAWDAKEQRFFNYRLDKIRRITVLDLITLDVREIQLKFEEMKKHIWGVSMGEGEIVHVEFLVQISRDEAYIINRLYREKRCGTVTPVDNCPGIFKFAADVYDAHEMFPWIRSFMCRIVELKISDSRLEKLFWDGISDMYKVYSIEGEQL